MTSRLPQASSRVASSRVDNPPSDPPPPAARHDRRHVLGLLAALGIGTATYQRALAASLEQDGLNAESIRQAEWIAGIELTDEQREETARAIARDLRNYEEARDKLLENSALPITSFFPLPPQGTPAAPPQRRAKPTEVAFVRPADERDLAYLPVTELSTLIRNREVSSVELTRLYLDRLHRHNETLNCVVTFTDDLAMRQAGQADRELARGNYRGPLHGIPWGAKDLIAYRGFPTTWGAPQFKDRELGETATVARRLDEAGAVLIAKLTLGALAWGDDWFGGITKNPWNPEQGSSGSSAGSASATAAGLVGFSLGSETLGSIVSPCRRCGATGLRPTFGRVSRHGCMTLAWTMDKIGPITRSVEDCALVLDAIHGYDGLDPTAVTRPFSWPEPVDLSQIRVGYFGDEDSDDTREELETLRQLGVQLQRIELPSSIPAGPLAVVLNTESAAAFDWLIRSGDLEGLNRWPGAWRPALFVPATEYLRANRLRTLLTQEMENQVFAQVDLYVGGNDLVITNLTGHPTVVLPHGVREIRPRASEPDNSENSSASRPDSPPAAPRLAPRSITFTGRLFGESKLLAVASAYQKATGHHLKHPPEY